VKQKPQLTANLTSWISLSFFAVIMKSLITFFVGLGENYSSWCFSCNIPVLYVRENYFLRVRVQGVVRVREWERGDGGRTVFRCPFVVLARRAVFSCPHHVVARRAQSSARHASR
jgi:hypothetical protein